MRLSRFAAFGLLALAAPAARAAETPATGKIVAADLFKNGLAVVTCEVTLGKAGEYLLDSVPQPVHGTFHLDAGTAKVEAAVKVREVTIPAEEAGSGNLQEDLAGKQVTITLKGANRPPVEGKMLKLKPAKGEEAVGPRFLVLQGPRGRILVDPAEVSSVEVGEAPAAAVVKRKRPQLVLTLSDTQADQTKVTIRYLTNGLSWAPSYRLDITDPKTLTLEQHAVVKNELADLDGAAIRLISGYPNVQYARVRSLIGPRTTLATFFAELENRYGGFEIDGTGNSVLTQNVAFNRAPVSTVLGATPTGEGVDLHYQPIGKRTLADGETLALTVAKGKADYARIVEWTAADSRDEYGRYADRGRGRDEDGEAWDALKFKNPLPFPMTTGPATVVAGGAFNGQRTTYWVNPGEETVLRVEKALSVRTRAVENEKPTGDRDLVWVGSRQYRKAIVEGELAVSNNRKEPIQMVIRRKFSGELVKADGEPKSNLLVEGVHSVNKRNELTWTLPLKGGEEKTLKYSYTVLVLN